MVPPKKFGFIHVTSHGLVSEESLCSWVIIISGHIVVTGNGSMHQATQACAKVQTAVAVSVHDLVVAQVSLPTKNQNQRRIAIPYAIQKKITTSANDMHWSWRANGQILDLVGMPNSQATAIKNTLKSLAFSPKWLLADGLHLGGQNSHWQLMLLSNQWLMQQSHHSAYCIDNQTPLMWLEKAYAQAQSSASGAPLSISIYGQVSKDLEQWLIDTQMDTHNQEPTEALNSAAILSQNFDVKKCINLLPQTKGKVGIPSINWKLWRLPYTLMVVLGLLGLSHLWLNNIATSQKIETAHTQGELLFQSVLPNERLVDPINQLKIKIQGANTFQKGVVFLPMLQAFVQFNSTLNPETNATIASLITWSDEYLQITLEGSPKSLSRWPSQGVLAEKYSYKTGPIQVLDEKNRAITISLSSMEEH